MNNKLNWMRELPIAHRGLHDAASKTYENSLTAARLAMEAGYAIEVDLQPSSDGVPMVFHDYSLKRLTGKDADIRETPVSELQTLKLGESEDTIPTLRQLLDLISGRVPVVLEFKGLPGSDDGFVAAAAAELENYQGDFAIMSFYHHILQDARQVCPDFSLGLTAEDGDEAYDKHQLAVDQTDPDFVSYHWRELDNRFIREFKKTGKPIISWTIRSEQEAEISAHHADQITFEGYFPAVKRP